MFEKSKHSINYKLISHHFNYYDNNLSEKSFISLKKCEFLIKYEFSFIVWIVYD